MDIIKIADKFRVENNIYTISYGTLYYDKIVRAFNECIQ